MTLTNPDQPTLGVPYPDYRAVVEYVRGAPPEERQNLAYLLKQLEGADQAHHLWEFRPGDTVRFNAKARPNYLTGMTATVVRANRTRIVITLNQPTPGGRFAGEVTCPLSIIEKVIS